jgi:hypothetical protein
MNLNAKPMDSKLSHFLRTDHGYFKNQQSFQTFIQKVKPSDTASDFKW